jgi:exosortase
MRPSLASRSIRFEPLLTWGSLGLIWFSLWSSLWIDWQTNALYAFGWSIPFLALYFAVLRWRQRPLPEPLAEPRRCLYRILWCAILLLIPLRFLAEANAEWRLLYWVRWACCATVTAGWLLLIGGKPWIRCFLFPLLFTAISIPWPTGLETPVLQTLMQGVAAITIEALFHLGIPAIRLGNLVQLAGDTVGLSEACSGLRSIQSSLMLSLVFGELSYLSRTRRILLTFLALATALLLNAARTLFLSWLAHRGGAPLLNQWHDSAGTAEMILCLILIALFAQGLHPRTAPSAPPACAITPVRSTVPPLFPIAVCLVWLFSEGITQLWYHHHRTTRPSEPAWSINPAPKAPTHWLHFHPIEIPETTKAQLRTNDAVAYAWQTTDGLSANLTWATWPEGRSSIGGVNAHRPDVCMTAAGHHCDGETASVTISIHGRRLSFRHYLFDRETRPLHSYFSLVDLDHPIAPRLEADLTFPSRFQAALQGQRNPRQAIVEVTIGGTIDKDRATAHLEETVKTLLRTPPLNF